MNYFKKIIVAATLLFSFLAFSQLGDGVYFGKKRYEKVEIILENGQSHIGYIRDFTNYRHSFNTFSEMQSLEKKLGLLTKKFYFRKNENAEDTEISIDDLKSIIVLNAENNGENVRWDKLKLKTINSSYKPVDLKKKAMIPLCSDGKLKVYGYLIGHAGDINVRFIPYFKERESEYTYIPIDINRVNPFNFGKMKGKLKIALKEATKKCPKMNQYLDEKFNKLTKQQRKQYRKDVVKRYENLRKEVDKIKKTVENVEMQVKLMRKTYMDYNIQPYIEIQEKYNELCDE